MKAAQGAANPLMETADNIVEGIKQMDEAIDLGADYGSIFYNYLKTSTNSMQGKSNPWGPEGGNDTFDANFGYQLHNRKLPGLIIRVDPLLFLMNQENKRV